MLFFKFHIGDWESGTKLLTPTEKGVYLDLLLLYYSKEEPILRSYCERITKGYTDEERKAFDYVVSEFFTEADGRLYHSRCEEEINASREKSQKARQSVMARYKKATNEERTYNERSTDDLLTNNHKSLANNQVITKKSKPKKGLEKPEDVTDQVWEDFCAQRKSLKAPLTQTALDLIKTEAEKAGISLNEALSISCSRGWRSFKAEWVQEVKNGFNAPHLEMPQPKSFEPDWDQIDYGPCRPLSEC